MLSSGLEPAWTYLGEIGAWQDERVLTNIGEAKSRFRPLLSFLKVADARLMKIVGLCQTEKVRFVSYHGKACRGLHSIKKQKFRSMLACRVLPHTPGKLD